MLSGEDLESQRVDDHKLLSQACDCNAEGWFRHVAAQGDRGRICGLSPTYVLLQVLQPERGELLKYDQAAEGGGMSCVSFASVAFY